MSKDMTELKRLAEAAEPGFGSFDPSDAEQEFMLAIKPDNVLQLISEVEQLRAELAQCLAMAQMVEEHEWAEHVGKGPVSSRVEAAFTQMYNDLSAAQEAPAAVADERDERIAQLESERVRMYGVIGLHISQPVYVLITNFENCKDFAEKLHAVEREFFMVPGKPSDEPEDEGFEPEDVCLVNSWGSSTEQYVEQFRAALARRELTVESLTRAIKSIVAIDHMSPESVAKHVMAYLGAVSVPGAEVTP